MARHSLLREVSAETNALDVDERWDSLDWKVKKWAAQLLLRFYER